VDTSFNNFSTEKWLDIKEGSLEVLPEKKS
jgi:hypothetical protein